MRDKNLKFKSPSFNFNFNFFNTYFPTTSVISKKNYYNHFIRVYFAPGPTENIEHTATTLIYDKLRTHTNVLSQSHDKQIFLATSMSDDIDDAMPRLFLDFVMSFSDIVVGSKILFYKESEFIQDFNPKYYDIPITSGEYSDCKAKAKELYQSAVSSKTKYRAFDKLTKQDQHGCDSFHQHVPDYINCNSATKYILSGIQGMDRNIAKESFFFTGSKDIKTQVKEKQKERNKLRPPSPTPISALSP